MQTVQLWMVLVFRCMGSDECGPRQVRTAPDEYKQSVPVVSWNSFPVDLPVPAWFPITRRLARLGSSRSDIALRQLTNTKKFTGGHESFDTSIDTIKLALLTLGTTGNCFIYAHFTHVVYYVRAASECTHEPTVMIRQQLLSNYCGTNYLATSRCWEDHTHVQSVSQWLKSQSCLLIVFSSEEYK